MEREQIMKKINKIAFMLLLILLGYTAMFSIKAEAASENSGKCGKNLKWIFNGSTGTLTISGTGDIFDYSVDTEADSGEASGKEPGWYKKKVKKIIIKEGATRIGSWAFAALGEMESISIPQSMTSVGKGAFEGDISLERIEFPDNVTEIAPDALGECWGLKELVIGKGYSDWKLKLPDYHSELGSIIISKENSNYQVIDGLVITKEGTEVICSVKTIEKLIIPDGVKIIEADAFNYCEDLKSIILPDGLTNIMDRAFCNCSSLESISIPDSVTDIGTGVFQGCSALQELRLGSGLKEWETVSAFEGCNRLNNIIVSDKNESFISTGGILATKDGKRILFIAQEADKVILPEGLKVIGKNLFQGRNQLKSVSIPESVEWIEAEAFKNCSCLEKITLPDNIKGIDSYAFYGCKSLKAIMLPDSVTSLGVEVFSSCEGLETIGLSDKLKEIPMNTFLGCKSLTSITVPDQVTSIGKAAFANCEGLEEIVLPDNLDAISASTFYGCTALKAIKLPEALKSIGEDAFRGCGLKSIVIPDSVTLLDSEAFMDCNHLEEVILSKKIKSVKAYVFYNCSALSKVEIKNGTKYIGYYAFVGCSSLKEIILPSTVTSIKNSFSGDTQLIFTEGISKSITNISSIEINSGKVLVEWNPIKEASGYQLMYSTKSNFNNAVTKIVKNANVFEKSFSLKTDKNKLYYIKIRAYQVINGKTVYGKWGEGGAFRIS